MGTASPGCRNLYNNEYGVHATNKNKDIDDPHPVGPHTVGPKLAGWLAALSLLFPIIMMYGLGKYVST